MRQMLVLRPEPGATATAERIAAIGGRAIVAPLFTIEPLAWTPPPADRFDALMLTSANAIRLGGAQLADYRRLPAYAVGASTASAMRAAGFEPAGVGEGDAADLLARIAADGCNSVLHPTGEDFRDAAANGVAVTHVPVYRARAVSELPEAARTAIFADPVALLHSPRAARLFGDLLERSVIPRQTIAIAAISAAAAAAAETGWRALAVAAQPSDHALLAAAARLCEE